MAAGLVVRRVVPSEWTAFRDLRLESLATDPPAFGSTLAVEAAYPEARWRSWCAQGAEGDRAATFFAAGPSAPPVGMVGAFSADPALKLWGMWVRPDHRGRGVGRRLLETVLRWADAERPRATVLLDVNPQQAAAVALYRSAGFRDTGAERPLGHDEPAVAIEMRRVPPA